MKLARAVAMGWLGLMAAGALAQQNPFDQSNEPPAQTAPRPGRLGLGIGAAPDGRPIIQTVVSGSPAEQAGVLVGDRVILVQGQPIDSYDSIDDLLAALQGEAGTVCNLQLLRNGQTVNVAITRAPLPVPNEPGNNTNPANPFDNNPPVQPQQPQPPRQGPMLPPGFRPDVSPMNIMTTVAPNAVNAPRPAIVRPGLRLVYYLGSAQIPGSPWQLVPDPEGTWVNKQTGQRYKEDYVSGSGGMGWNVFDVGYVDDQVVAGYNRSYVLDVVTRNTGVPGSDWGAVFPGGLGGEYWISTDVLHSLVDQRDGDLLIRRLRYPLNGREYNAIRIQSTCENAKMSYTYDLDTGLLIHYGSATVGQNANVTGPGGNSQTGAGVMTIVSLFILDARQVNVPWINDPVPAWVSQFKRLRYEGASTTGLEGSGFPDMQKPLSMVVENKGSNGHWARTGILIRHDNSGYDLLDQTTVEGVSCNALAGSFYIPPAGLARLQPGQELDREPIVGTVLFVSDVNNQTVTISERGSSFQRDAVYDRQSGLLVRTAMQRNMSPGRSGTHLQLVGQE